jgi:hypothetical protein
MSKFIALPVGQGDAFYLEREDFRVLVDGGKSKTAISPWMQYICKIDQLDVLICTHNDADHANGVIGLLENWDGIVTEVWLPGSWTYRMKDLFLNPARFYEELINKSMKAAELGKRLEYPSLERLGGCKEISSKEKDLTESDSFDLRELVDTTDHFVDCSFFEDDFGFYPYHRYIFCHLSPIHRLIFETLSAANNITNIVSLAYDRGCAIRFFEFGKAVSGGRPGSLVPVNSGEMLTLKSKAIDALTYLALTTANKESLAFLSPEDERNPAVLFTADSDLNFPLPSTAPRRGPIITGPHHGSEDNANAYGVVQKWLTSKVTPIWVRSDCKTNKRPGNSFISQRRKYCTLCNCGTHPKQTIELHSSGNNWSATAGTRSCSCR